MPDRLRGRGQTKHCIKVVSVRRQGRVDSNSNDILMEKIKCALILNKFENTYN